MEVPLHASATLSLQESDSADDRLERRLSDELSTELLGEEAADSPRSPPAADPWVAGAAAAAGLPLAHLAPALCGLVAAGARPGATLERLSSMLVPGGAAQPPKELASPGSSPRRGDTATGLPLQLADKERREAAIDALSLRLRLSFSPPH
eukprot:scaffold10.g2367.t1